MDRKEARRVWRDGIKAAWNYRCAYCNGVPIHDASLTADHIIPKSAGGQDLTRNIVPACASCNSKKGSQEWRSWFERQSFYCPIRAMEIDSWMQQGTRDIGEWWEVGLGDLEWCIKQIEERGEESVAAVHQSPRLLSPIQSLEIQAA